MNEGLLDQTFDRLQSVLALRAECRRSLREHGAAWSGAPEALSLLDDLNEHAVRLLGRCGLGRDEGRVPERGSPDWRRMELPLAA